jgi:hypothetical protein
LTRRNEAEHLTSLDNGSVLLAGGHDHDACCDALISSEVFDPLTGEWRATGSMRYPRGEHTQTQLASGDVLVVGGFDWGTETAPPRAEVFDSRTEEWRAVGEFPEPGLINVAVRLDDGRVLVKGDRYSRSTWLYDAAEETFTASGAMLVDRLRPTFTLLLDGRVLAAGGNIEGERATDTTEIFDPSTATWTPGPTMIDARFRHTATLFGDGKVLVTGSRGGAGSAASTEMFDPSTGSWIDTGLMAVGRESHTALLLDDGRVLVTGGWPTRGVFDTYDSAEIFRPDCID